MQWQEHRKQLPDLIRAAQDKAKEIKQTLTGFSPDDHAQVSTARKTLLRARLRAADKEIELLEKELASHDELGRLYQLRFDHNSTKEQAAKKQVEILQEAVDRMRKEEVEKKKERAERELVIADEIHPVARKLAEDIDWFLRARDMDIEIFLHNDVVLYCRKHQSNISYDRKASYSYLINALQTSVARRRDKGN